MENAPRETEERLPVSRDLATVTAEIKDLFAKARTVALAFIVEIGRRLKEAKAMLPHGEFGGWLKDNFDLSASTAGNYMRLFEEYGSDQLTLFGAVSNSQSIGNLPYTKALQLLAVPAEEREAFAERVDAENISVSELKAAIAEKTRAERERDDAIREREEAKNRQKELEQATAHAEIARVAAEARAKDAEALAGKVSELEAALAKAKESAKKAKEALKAAKEDPEIPVETMLKLKLEAEESAKKEAEAKAEERLSEIRAELDKSLAEAKSAKQAELEARERVVELQKKMQMSSPLVAEFKAGFETLQDGAARLRDLLGRIRAENPETGEKLAAALRAFAGEIGKAV